ncbi:unnamed protein product [Acanthocheilonema viteae]|uniref:Uncharacterized protein n=1 Tax=Acanthocheilonema viteae TaxID=6277 RepID=A0A498S9D0_ACAVI|nr:unnamed protein product [Acanthocheilonema viteae]
MELEQRRNPEDASDARNQIDNDEHQIPEVHNDEISISFDWRNYTFLEQKLKLKFASELCDIPNFLKAPIQKSDVSSNQKTDPFKEIRFACKTLTDYIDNFQKDHKLVAFTIEKMMPFLSEMIDADMKSKNISHDSIERHKNENLVNDGFEVCEKCKDHFYKDISSEHQKTKDFQKVNINSPINEMNDEMIAATYENDGTTSEMIVITSKIKELSLKSDGMSSEVVPGKSTVTVTKKQLQSVEANDGEVASISGISYEIEKIDSELQAEREFKEVTITQTVIKSIIVSSESVQKANQLALRNAELLLCDICEKKAVGQKMKSCNLLTNEQSESFEKEFNSYIKFATDIKNYISNLIQHVDAIASYVKLNEKKLLSNEDETRQRLICFEKEFCKHLLTFYDIALAGEKAREVFEKMKHELIAISDQELIDYESMFISHLLSFAILSRTFEAAWDVSDAYLDILHCLFILLVDVENISNDSFQGSNLAFLNKFHVKSTNVHKNAAISEKLNTQEQTISKKTPTPAATSKNTAKSSPESKARASLENKAKALPENETKTPLESETKTLPKNKTKALPENKVKALSENKTKALPDNKAKEKTYV